MNNEPICLRRHASGDWGVVGKDDAKANDDAVTEGDRILSAYPIDPSKPCAGHGANTLWIITEADRSGDHVLVAIGVSRWPITHTHGEKYVV
jgi:hypothetical protein